MKTPNFEERGWFDAFMVAAVTGYVTANGPGDDQYSRYEIAHMAADLAAECVEARRRKLEQFAAERKRDR